MPETGHTWQQAFKGLPEEASHVRDWTRSHVHHEDAPLVANELFTAILGTRVDRPDIIEMAISTAGRRIRITATGPYPLPVLQMHGPGALIVAQLCTASGVSTNFFGLWAQLLDAASPPTP
jgi:hypothetical protein